MRRVFSVIAAIILIVLVVLIIQRRPDDGTTGSPVELTDASTTATTQQATTTDRTEVTQPATTDEQSTDTTEPRVVTTAAPSLLDARFEIRAVVFGDDGYVVVENSGGTPASIGGYAICQRPNYFNLPDITLEPQETIWIAVGDGATLTATPAKEVIPAGGSLGSFDRDDGEMALYSTPAFASPEAIVSYVEWGSSGHGRSEVAVAAGIWTEGAFVEIPPDAFGVQAVESPADGAEDWVAGLGG